jgi:hypothetical protein
MGFRSLLGGNPGKRLAGIVAVAAVIAFSAQGAIGAPSDKKPKGARSGAGQQAGSKQQTPAPGTDQKVVRSVGGVQVTIDPKTGRMQPPTAEEAAKLAAALQTMLSHEADDLTPVQLPDGTIVIDLQDTFQEAVMASVNARGRVTMRCVSDPAQAARILAGESINDGVELSREAAKRATLRNRATAEKE